MPSGNESYSRIEDSDFMFENEVVSVTATRDSPRIDLIGFSVGPIKEGNEYEVRLWIARELENDGIVKIRDVTLDASRLYKIQWTERIQAVGQLSSLPGGFYPRLRRLIDDLKAASKSNPEKIREYEYIQNLSQDIVNCRLRKIVSLASLPTSESQILKNLTVEERELCERLHRIISEWRLKII
ncbi:MAG: hypothetical protein QXU67_06550 [Candidatus Bathyarchaeia archaeon]